VSQNYTPPQFKVRAFHCPYCGVYSNFYWQQLYEFQSHTGGFDLRPIHIAHCTHCGDMTFWLQTANGGRMIVPSVSSLPMPHEDLPEECAADFAEAREIAEASPRSAAALLRLALQKLFTHLGESGKNINDDIAALVKKGLPIEIQQALDIVRVTGNNAVHPGEMSFSDDSEIVISLFELINLIVDNRITQPKRVAALFNSLPIGAREAIAKRDGNG